MDGKQLLDAFSEAGLDTKEKVLNFLGGAVKPAAKAKIEEAIKAEREAFSIKQGEFNARLTALQDELSKV